MSFFMVISNKDMKDQNSFCVIILGLGLGYIIFVNTLDFDKDQLTFYNKLLQKTMKF